MGRTVEYLGSNLADDYQNYLGSFKKILGLLRVSGA